MTEKKDYALSRWRLVLGKYARAKMPQCLSPDQERMDQALELLYSREYGKGLGDRRVRRRFGESSLRTQPNSGHRTRLRASLQASLLHREGNQRSIGR